MDYFSCDKENNDSPFLHHQLIQPTFLPCYEKDLNDIYSVQDKTKGDLPQYLEGELKFIYHYVISNLDGPGQNGHDLSAKSSNLDGPGENEDKMPALEGVLNPINHYIR